MLVTRLQAGPRSNKGRVHLYREYSACGTLQSDLQVAALCVKHSSAGGFLDIPSVFNVWAQGRELTQALLRLFDTQAVWISTALA